MLPALLRGWSYISRFAAVAHAEPEYICPVQSARAHALRDTVLLLGGGQLHVRGLCVGLLLLLVEPREAGVGRAAGAALLLAVAGVRAFGDCALCAHHPRVLGLQRVARGGALFGVSTGRGGVDVPDGVAVDSVESPLSLDDGRSGGAAGGGGLCPQSLLHSSGARRAAGRARGAVGRGVLDAHVGGRGLGALLKVKKWTERDCATCGPCPGP